MITLLTSRDPALLNRLVQVWEASVRATHLFLPEAEIAQIKQYVPQALESVSHLTAVLSEDGSPAAFMGVEGQKLEMLFVSPEKRGTGLGKQLLQYAIREYAVNELAVNEQNPQARDFYEHMGFQVFRRSELDEQGNPYPILYMKLP